MKNIVYTLSYCAFCVMVKDLLQELGIEYEERVVSSAEEKARLKKQYNWPTFPLVILNGRFLGGYEDFKKLVEQGKLAEVMKR